MEDQTPSNKNNVTEAFSSNETVLKYENYGEKKDKRREKRPEMVRYQPPSTRTSKSTPASTEATSNKQSTSGSNHLAASIPNSTNINKNYDEKKEPQNVHSKERQQNLKVKANEKNNQGEKNEAQQFNVNEKQKYAEKQPQTSQSKSNLTKKDQLSASNKVTNHSNESKRATSSYDQNNKSNSREKTNKASNNEYNRDSTQENSLNYIETKNYASNHSESSRKDNALFASASKPLLKAKNTSEKSETIFKAASMSGGGGGGGGLIKLNQNALNEMIANHERMSRFNQLNETEDYQSTIPQINEIANDNYNESRNLNGNADSLLAQKGQHYKKLFDPNNPNKPIYMPDKSLDESSLKKKIVPTSIKREESNSTEFVKNIPSNKSEIVKVNAILNSINPLEVKLKHLVDSFECSNMFSSYMNEINSLRSQLENLCFQAMFTHIETAYNSNVDLNHWRSCYHQIIELLRKELNNINFNQKQQTNVKLKEQISKQISAYIDEGHLFFSNIIKNLEEKYLKFSIQHLIDLNYFERLINKKLLQSDTTIKTKDIKIALICANRCLISIGDLCRYKEMIFNSSSLSASALLMNHTKENQSSDFNARNDASYQRDYSTARSYYLKAAAVAPKSSRSYHQLAILAVYTKRRLDTCYYYFRCSEVSSPLTSVRQALNSLFEEARVRSDAIMKMISSAILNKKNKKLNSLLNSNNEQQNARLRTNRNRKEIWFKAPLSSTSSSSSSSLGKKTTNTFCIEDNAFKKSNNEIASDNSDKYSDDSDNDSDDEKSDDDEGFTDDDESDNEEDEEIKSEKFSLSCSNEKRLSVYELNKRFMLNYLNTIGKIFTKVGMESYPEVCSRMLHEFKELLRRKPNPFGRLRLLQITIINISLIDLTHKSSMDNNTSNQSGIIRRSQQFECALSSAIDMFVLVSKRFSYLLKRSKLLQNDLEVENDEANEINFSMSDDFDEWRHMYPSIKIFIDWMLCNANMWQPMPDQLPPDLGPNPDRWKIMASMFNLVQKLSTRLENLLEMKIDNKSKDLSMRFLSRVKLEEDLEVAGFVPLLSLSPRADYDYQNKYNTNELNMFLNETNLSLELIELAKMKKRSEKLCLFADYLCGLEHPILKYDVLNKCYNQITGGQLSLSGPEFNRLNQLKNESNPNKRTISTCSSSSIKSETDLINIESSLLNSMLKSSLNDESESPSSEQSIILNDLKEKRRLLKVKMQEQQKREMSHQSIIEMSTQRQIELEIRPKFIVPDTNCFIDHLNLIDRILSTSYYIVVVPLLVINELDKLSKSIANCNDDSIEHAEYVKSNANQAMSYLNEKFDKRERNLKALTSQGSVLETIQFRSEEVRKQGTTDELILGCCLHYCRDNARDFMPNNKSDAIRLFREVVLLTEDRHLRLKAHTRNVPVKNIIQFCKWSNLYNVKNKNYIVKPSNLPKNNSFKQANRNKKKI